MIEIEDLTTEDELIIDEDFTPEELAEIEALKAQAERDWLARARRDVANDVDSLKRAIADSGTDLADYIHENAASAADELVMCKRFGVDYYTFADPRARRMRDGKKKAHGERTRKAEKLQRLQREKQDAPKVEAVKPEAVKAAPSPQEEATAYATALAAEYPAKAAKIEKSLAYQLSVFDSSIAYFTERGQSQAKAVEIWATRARMAFDKKVEGS